jgi:hypothetical protein
LIAINNADHVRMSSAKVSKEMESDQGCTTCDDAASPEPSLLTLHLGYARVVIGTALFGPSIPDLGVPVLRRLTR